MDSRSRPNGSRAGADRARPLPMPGTCFSARDAVAVLRAWRRWAAAAPVTRNSSFRIVRLPDTPDVCAALRGAPFLATDELTAEDLVAVGLHGRGPLHPLPGVGELIATREHLEFRAAIERNWTPVCDAVEVVRLDDWAIDSFLRAGTSLTAGLTPGLRHGENGFALFAYGIARSERHRERLEEDLTALMSAANPWIRRPPELRRS